MNNIHEEVSDQKIEEIIVSLEIFILYVIRTAVNRLLEAAFLQDASHQNQNDDL